MRFVPFLLVAAIAAAPTLAEEAPPEAAAAAPPAVTVAEATRAPVVDRVRGSGLIEPVERVLVQPQIEGLAIEALAADVGDWVEAGETLARLSDAQLQLEQSRLEASRASAEAAIAQAAAQVIEAEAIRDQAARDRDRVVELEARGTASAAAADAARAEAASAAARTEAAAQARRAAEAQLRLVDAELGDVALQLRRTAVRAPVAGEVTERAATVGGIASMGGEPMFVIVRDGALELRADVAEQDLLRLQAGQEAAVLPVGADAPLAGVVRLVEPAVDRASRLGRVRIAVEAPGRVRAGMFAEAEIRVRDVVATVVPASAVHLGPEGASVLVVRDGGRVERAPIAAGIRDGALVEAASGLDPGDVVVAKAGAFVRPGDRITPVAAPAEPLPAETAAVSNWARPR